MHTEHLQNVTVSRVAAAWLVAAAVTSFVAFVLIATGLLTEESTTANTWWSAVAVAAGFFAGGFFAGFRAIEAPILHAVAIGVMSIVVTFVLNALSALVGSWPLPPWTPQLMLGLLVIQLAAAIIGALLGYNLALSGKPGLSEHEPIEDPPAERR